MASQTLAGVLRFISRLASANGHPEHSDGHLLQQFVAKRDEAAFVTLLQRHGPLVLGVCRQVLADVQDAEDAFQATFLVLARKAASIRKKESLAGWLYRVALNISRSVKTNGAKRRVHERQAVVMSQPDRVDEVGLREWQALIHEEVDTLPEKYRVLIVLCYLQGKTHEEAARELGCPLGTVKGRLARARDLLQTGLVRRGLTLSASGLAAALTESAALGQVPAPLLAPTLKAAVSFLSGASIPAGVVSTQAIALAKGALQTMTTTKLASMLVMIAVGLFGLTLGVIGMAAAFGPRTDRDVKPDDFAAAKEDRAAPAKDKKPASAAANELKAVRLNEVDFPQDEKPDAIKNELKKLDGTWRLVAAERGGKAIDPEQNFGRNVQWTFSGTTCITVSGFRSAKGNFTIDPTKNPKWIDVKFPAGDSTGIYELKAETLRLIFASPGEKRPTEFKTKEGTPQAILTYERVLWTPRLLASAEVPLPELVVQADLVVSGRVVSLEPEDVEAVLSQSFPNKVNFRIAVVKIHEVVHGQKTVKEFRLGFISPEQDRKVDKDVKAMALISGHFVQRFTVGQDGLFYLRKHHQGDFYRGFVRFGGFVDSRDGASFTKNLEDVRRLNKVLEAPMEALKAANATNRFVAATMLIHRYRLSWQKERKLPEKAIDAEESKLLLKTLAEADWQDMNIDMYPPGPYRVFLELGVKKADGYDPPANPSDSRQTLRYTQTWIRDNQEKYRIQRFSDAK